MIGQRIIRHLACFSYFIMISSVLSACGHCYSAPKRTTWPVLTAPVGTTLVEEITTPLTSQAVIFNTEMTREQIDRYYLDTLGPQGWLLSTTGQLIEPQSCPGLWLEISPLSHTGSVVTYRIILRQGGCNGYC